MDIVLTSLNEHEIIAMWHRLNAGDPHFEKYCESSRIPNNVISSEGVGRAWNQVNNYLKAKGLDPHIDTFEYEKPKKEDSPYG